MQRRREVFKARLESKRFQAIRFAREREKIRNQRRIDRIGLLSRNPRLAVKSAIKKAVKAPAI